MSDTWGILSKYLNKPSATVEVSNLFFNMEFDVVTTESHKWEATVTSNPVEMGTAVTDHVQLSPDTVEIAGIISNASLEVSKGKFIDKLLGLLDGESNVQRAFDQLRKLLENRQPVTVYTRYKTYSNMVLTSLSIPRSKDSGDSIEFTASFTHVRRVSTLTVDAEDAGINPGQTSSTDVKHRSEPKNNAGKQNTSQVDNNTEIKTETVVNNQTDVSNKQTNHTKVSYDIHDDY